MKIDWCTGNLLVITIEANNNCNVRYNGSEITLRDVQPKDEGDYACQLNSIETPIELVHHLNVLSK